MKKLLYILILCLCLNGVALASETEAEPAPQAEPATLAEPAAPVESASQAEPAAPAEPADGNADGEKPPPKADGDGIVGDGDGIAGDGNGADGPADPAGAGDPDSPETPEGGQGGPADPQGTADAPAEARRLLESGMTDEALQAALEGLSKGDKVYVNATKDAPVCLKGAAPETLAEAEFLPDDEVFKDDGCQVRFALAEPGGAEKVYDGLKALAKDADGETADVWLWVEKPAAVTEDEPVDPSGKEDEPAPAAAVQVSCEGFTSGTWMTEWPEFRLSGIPEGRNWDYAAIIYDERIAVLSADRYVPEQEGVYALRFAILDELGDIVSASEKFTLMLDCTPPDAIIEIDENADYTLNISAGDSVSGVAALSVDGGETWIDMEDGGAYAYAAGGPATVPAGAIRVRDAAGNVFESTEEYALRKTEPEPYDPGYYGGFGGGGGGGGGGDGAKKPAKTHASGTGEDSGEYDALQLELPEEPMTQLTVGGRALPLTLALTEAQESGAPLGGEQPFTAALARWTPAPAEGEEAEPLDDDGAMNTLVLTAEPAANLGDRFTYEWRFNGEVYRELANSGIQYVALRVGGDVAAFPTQGFTGGTKYTELKMLGVSTRRFDYALTMKVNLDPGYVSALTDCDYSLDCDLAIRAEVENMAYELSSSIHSVMYFYDVYLGPPDMLEQPFGAYRAES